MTQRLNRGMIDEHAVLLHHLFEIAQTQGVGDVPPYAHQHDIQGKALPLDQASGAGEIDEAELLVALDELRRHDLGGLARMIEALPPDCNEPLEIGVQRRARSA
jgi:hypothetical protein